MPHNEWSNIIPATWTTAVSSALLQHNWFARELHFMSNLSTQECPNAHLILNDGVGKIAAILRLDNTAAGNYTPRSTVIRKMDNSVSQIGSISRLWEPLAYRLLFPHEEEYLHAANILVDPATEAITGILDWEMAGFRPAWLAAVASEWFNDD
ncbi:hypothetical protein M422DRAFT_253844 [Sphaerobolus stellatus SS14]|uniref:Aminoglycoside phosphotransferase domain-containing protein n=1 Tax=Sphaerobolus stellatus (strain SS14) TaxID=990650 RepID=A0A0C9VWB9_SPHS4|nr:hypothetical protein M422DRAFT_253844 [Sphaerobolus stellatus SS14]